VAGSASLKIRRRVRPELLRRAIFLHVLQAVDPGAHVGALDQLFDWLWEVVRARGLHQLAPVLWPLMLVEKNGHGKGLPRNRRGGELDGADAIAGDVLIRQERRTALWVDDLRGFTQEEGGTAARSRFSADRTGARLTRRGEGLDAIDKKPPEKAAYPVVGLRLVAR
jgi:hypothetical protein